ncbi:hypothetical protein [Corallococcus sp. M7]
MRKPPTVALPDGRVLFLGGTGTSSTGSMVPLASIEKFDLSPPPCTPTTCAAQGKNCGTLSNGCGGTLNCGTCGSGLTCTNNVCGTGAPASCSHDVCTSGTVLSNSCGTCANKVCTIDPFCCNSAWDSICVSEANSHCVITQPGCVAQ